MATTKKHVGAALGAALLAGSAVLGINKMNTVPASHPIAVAHGLCESGKTVSQVHVGGKAYPKGTPCTAIVSTKRK